MSNEQIEVIEIHIDELKKIVAMKKSIQNLKNNIDFQRVISQGYFREHAARSVMLKADPTRQTPKDQFDLDNQINAISYLNLFLQSQEAIGVQAERDIIADEKTREEMLAEDLENN